MHQAGRRVMRADVAARPAGCRQLRSQFINCSIVDLKSGTQQEAHCTVAYVDMSKWPSRTGTLLCVEDQEIPTVQPPAPAPCKPPSRQHAQRIACNNSLFVSCRKHAGCTGYAFVFRAVESQGNVRRRAELCQAVFVSVLFCCSCWLIS